MRDKYPFFNYVTGNSKVHNMNSKYKVLFIIIYILLLILLRDKYSTMLISLLTLFVLYKTKINLLAYIYNAFRVWIVYVISFIISFIFSLDVLFSIFITYKVFLIIIILLFLTFTTSLSEIAWGIECLFSKLKKINIPVSKIALRIAMDIKFVSTLFLQASTIRKSMAYRGVSYHNHTKALRSMIIPVITLSYKLSRRMQAAMKLRFYGYSKRRTNYHENKTTSFDKVLIVLEFVLLYVIIWLGWYVK